MPQDPTPNTGAYDFLNQQPTKPPRKLPLPKLPRMAWIILIGSVSFLMILVAAALLFGGGRTANTSPYIESLALAQEINRVSDTVKELAQDSNTQSLATTASSVMLSNNTRLSAYLKKIGIKVEPQSLSLKLDGDIDGQLRTEAQANRLPAAYFAYLKVYLQDYQSSLQKAYNESGAEGKSLIKEAYDSVEVILSTPAVKSS